MTAVAADKHKKETSMNFLQRLTSFFHRGDGKSELQKNMEKALQMKQAAGPQTHIPEHQTAHAGMQPHEDDRATGSHRGNEATYTPHLKQTRVARSGDPS